MNDDHAKSASNKAAGTAKEQTGKVIDNEQMEAEGKAQQAKGEAQETKGDLKDKV